MSVTEEYVRTLSQLKAGELGLLRAHAMQDLDESVQGFDLFAGLWWPLRQKNQHAPRRQVAWLVAKLYASCPLEHAQGHTLARQLRRCQPPDAKKNKNFRAKFDALLSLPLERLEPSLRWAIARIAENHPPGKLDWAKLTDDLSSWERETTRLRWAEEFLNYAERG